ncbi:MAG: terminase family protein, partial [Clostridia bacterium]
NRSGKTECGAAETVWLARGNHPFKNCLNPISCWVVSLSQQVQRDVAQRKVLYYLNPDWISEIKMLSGRKGSPDGGVIDYILVKHKSGGESRIGFKSCDQGREKFQGTSLDFVWFDEEPPYDIYCECKMRVLDRCGMIFGTMTPLKGLSWVYGEIYLNDKNQPDIWHEHMEWADNPYLDKSEIANLTASLSSEELESRRFGKFACSGGMVYSEFDENTHVIDPFTVPKEWFDNISIDPGLNNPLSAHWYAVDFDGNVYVIAESYMAGKDILWHSNKIKEISQNLGWQLSYNGMISAIIDSAATQRTLSGVKSVVDLFYDNGILANPKVDKDMFAGISRVKSY